MCRGREAAFDEGRAGRQRERRLRDVFVGMGEDAGPEFIAFCGRRRGADQHPVATRAVHLLDDDLVEALEHVVPVLGTMKPPGRHVVQDRLLTQVELDHVGDVGIDRLVVGDAGADRIGERHASGAIGGEQAGHAKHRVGTKRARIEKIVVHPAVDHVDPLRSLRRAHVHRVALHEEVDALDELDTHLLGEERVFVIGRVVGTRRQHGDRRRLFARGRQRVEVLEQEIGVVLHRPDRLRREELGKEPHHHPAVFEHVGHAGGDAEIVLEHVILAFVGADDIHARDVRIDVAGNVHPVHLLAVLVVAEHALARDDARGEDLLVVIDVVQECVQRADALAQSDGRASSIRPRE